MPPRPPRRRVSNAPCVHILRPTTSKGDHTYEKQLLSRESRDDKCEKSGHHGYHPGSTPFTTVGWHGNHSKRGSHHGHHRELKGFGLHLDSTAAHFRHKNRGKCLKERSGQGRNRSPYRR